MPDMLTTSVTGMLAFQRALAMTGHNIANVNTPGYSRQVATFTTRPGQGSGNGFIGAGTQITTIRRIYDVLLAQQLRTSSSGLARFSTLDSLATKIDSLLSNPGTGINSTLQTFFNSVQDLANDPASIPARQAVLGEASNIVQRFRGLDDRLGEVEAELNQRINQSVTDINQLADSIAEVNDNIVVARARTGQPPNDLLDQRDYLVRRLSEQVAVSTVMQDDGSMNIFIGSGQTLVLGSEAKSLGVQGGEFDPTRLQIVYQGVNGNTPLDTGLTGGTIGGLLEFRTRMLDPTRQALGETALALVGQFNEQHAAGMDLRGAMGGDFFGIDPPTILHSSFNTGGGTASATVSDLGALTGVDYVLEYDGVAYTLSRADTGAVVPMAGSGTIVDPFVADGLSISVGGAAAAGDRIMIRPTRDAADSISRVISDPQAIAMAAPVRTLAAYTNLGDATISAGIVVDRKDPDLLSTSLIEFTDPTTYTINGAGPFAYTAGNPIIVNGVSVQIDGSPLAGDQFTLEANFGGSGNNANGLRLAQVQSTGVLDGGTISINDNYGQLVAGVGSTSQQIKANLDAQTVILSNVEESYLSKSGVNLDEEAANLIRYQQAYQAVAQIVAVASTLFDSLLEATRR